MMEGDTVKYQRPQKQASQVLYLGRFVDHDSFRAFVYSAAGETLLAQNYAHYTQLVASGQWFSTQEDAKKGVEVSDATVLVSEEQKTEVALKKIRSIKNSVKAKKNGVT